MHLYTIYPHGSTDKLPMVTMGSGSLAAMAIFESEFKPNMTVRHQHPLACLALTQQKEEAMALAAKAITAGITNDLGSGSNVDLVVITKEGMRGYSSHTYYAEFLTLH